MAAIIKFTKFLEANNIPPAVQQFMLQPQAQGGLGWQSISDFAGYFIEKDYEDGVESEILAATPTRTTKRRAHA